MRIKKKAQQITRKYKETDPFKIAEHLGIIVRFADLGKTWGFFATYKRVKIININTNISVSAQRFTCAHELGHALLHPHVPTPFLKKHTLFSIEKIERQANTFAVELLLPDSLFLEYEDTPVQDLALIVGIPPGLEILKIPPSF